MATRREKAAPPPAKPASRPASKKVKRPSGREPSRLAPRVSAPKIIASLLATLPPLTNVQRHAFRDQWSLQQCDEAGELTKATDVYRDAIAWAPTIHRTLITVPHAIRRYTKARFAWFLECVRDLSEVIEAERSGAGSPDAARHRTARATMAALALRAELTEALSVLAGGDVLERRALEAASGSADTPDALGSSLRALSRLSEGWLERESPGAKALVASVDLTAADVDAARAATHALAFATYEASHGARSDREAPIINRAEGRVLLEMRLILRIFERARPLNDLIPKLTLRPALDAVMTGPSPVSARGNSPPTLELPVTTREGQGSPSRTKRP